MGHAPVDNVEIKWAQDWLAQHIKNTDFGYKGHLKHEVPEPYVWDKSFATDYHRLDEEHGYCAVPEYNCVDHKMKHYKFWVILDDLQVPVGCEEINWSKNWLAQHIKNTDHGYKTRLLGPDTGENFSGALP